jgi:hypothetical protein
LAALRASLEVNAMMDMQYFIPTEGFQCDEDLFGYDSCIFQAVQGSGPSCVLPFQNLSVITDMKHKICKTHADGYASFQQFQLTHDSCKVRCSQLNTVFNYYMPQHLRGSYLYSIKKEATMFAYYLYLPSAIKVSKASPSYGFVTFIAEVAGWYNLFLGGSVFAMWKVLGKKILWALAKILKKLSQLLLPWQNYLYILMSIGILIYIFLDCMNILVLNPVGSNILLAYSIVQGLCLSICLPQYTSEYTRKSIYSLMDIANTTAIMDKENTMAFLDMANTTAFWVNGSSLRNKILDLNLIMQEKDVITIWNSSQSSIFTQTTNLFSIFNIVSSNLSVDFCHTLDLSLITGNMRMVQLRAVNDITLVVHLSGQLLAAKAKYGVANTETLNQLLDTIFLYNSEVSLQLEETSFQNVNTQSCKNYNTTWTYDSCVMDHAITVMGGHKTLLRQLLMPSNDSTVPQGTDRAVLRKLYAALLLQNSNSACLPDCRSLIVNMRAETSPTKAQPARGIPVSYSKDPLPLPPLIVDVKITLPDFSKLTQVTHKYSRDKNKVTLLFRGCSNLG